MDETRQLTCATRAVKNVAFLQTAAPNIMPAVEPPEGFGSVIPLRQLGLLHAPQLLRRSGMDAKLADSLKSIAFPQVANVNANSLFKGRLVFLNIQFTVVNQNNAIIALSDSDFAVAVDYARQAAIPIAKYASQYGPNTIAVEQNVRRLDVPCKPHRLLINSFRAGSTP
jgi:hypothetical protein